MFGVSAILNGAFGLVRARIGAVAIWGVVYLLCSIALMAAMFPMFTAMAATPGSTPEPLAIVRAAGGILIMELVFCIILVVLFAAAFRAVLHPEKNALGYLRLGMDELRLLGLSLLVGVLSFVAYIIYAMVTGVVGTMVAISAGTSAGIVLNVVLVLVWLAAFLYVQVRLSLAGPLSVYRGRFVLGESWKLTRGRFWSIFLAYLVIFLMFLVVYVIFAVIMYLPMIGAMRESMSNSQDPAAAQAMMAQFAGRYSTLSATTIGFALVGGLMGGLWVGLNGGAAATAANLLLDDRDVAATFE